MFPQKGEKKTVFYWGKKKKEKKRVFGDEQIPQSLKLHTVNIQTTSSLKPVQKAKKIRLVTLSFFKRTPPKYRKQQKYV